MKKLAILTIAAASFALTSCSLAGAGSLLTGALGSGAGSTTGNTTGSTAGSAASSLAKGVAGVLTNGNGLDNLLSTFLGGVAFNEENLYGSWTYQGVDVAFESENFLAKAGGAVAAGTVESKIDEQLQKYGIKPGAVKFTFNKDHTFTAVLGGKNVSGTYTYEPKTRALQLTAAFGLFNQTCTVGNTAKGISLLFPADKLLSLASTAGALLGNANSTIGALTGLLKNYNGMQIGLEMTK